jgi:cysteine desulfurase/selenocysteine lyase
MLTAKARLTDFPSLVEMSYLNTAAEGIPPRAVGQALAQYAEDKKLGMDGRPLHEAQWEGAKALIARAYGLNPQEVSICSCSSEAFNLAALALRLQPGDEVIINDLDFPAGATPWLQPTCPATVKLWRAVDGALRVEDLVALLSPRTRLVTTSLVSFYNGFMVPLPAMVEAIRKHSPALLALDVTQALGRIPLRLSGVDLVVSSTHKWILASHGGGLVGVPAARAAELTAPAGGWFNQQSPFEADRFEKVGAGKGGAYPLKPGAASFTVGMPNYPTVYAIRAGLGYVLGIGVKAIDAYAQPLVQACLEGIRKLPVQLLTPPDERSLAGIIAFRHPQAERLHQALHERNIHIMAHAGRLRVAIHGYNTAEDIERFLRVLRDTLTRV